MKVKDVLFRPILQSPWCDCADVRTGTNGGGRDCCGPDPAEPSRSVICKKCGETMTTWSATTPRLSSGANFPVGEQAMTTHSIGHLIEGFNRMQTHRGIEHAAVS